MKRAFRQFARSPGLSVVIVVSLALGLGANTVIFSWLKAVVFHPLPGVTAPVLLVETKDDTGNYVSTSWLEYQDLRALLPSFSALAAHRSRTLNLGDSERESRVFTELVSENFFSVLDLQPALGRFFRAEEATVPGSAPVAVLAHDFWQHYFHGASGVISQTLKLNGRVFTIIGVAPAGFHGAFNNLNSDVFLPLTMAAQVIPASNELTIRSNRPDTLLARLRPGVSVAQARGELAAAAAHLIATHPETNRGLGYELLPLWRSPRGGVTLAVALVTLQVFAVLILIVVCANTANLLLARASTRGAEIGIRLALGAGPARIMAQLIAESVVLALVGAGAGLLVALWGTDALAQIPLPGSLPIRLAPPLDWSSVLFTSTLGLVCGVIFGLAPALQLARSDILGALRGGRGAVTGRSLVRDALVGLEVCTALVVLVLAGLFFKSFQNALAARPGFDADSVMLVSLDLGGRGYNAKTGQAFLDDLLQRLAALPQIEHAAAANYVPLDLHGPATGVISIDGQPFDPNRKILYYGITPGYFATMGIPLDGADLARPTSAGRPLDAVIGDEMARRYWPGENPIGRRFEVDGSTFLIAGIARTPKLEKINESPRPAAWVALRRQFVSTPTLYVRVREGDPASVLPSIRATVRQLDPELAVLDARPLRQHLENNLFLQRMPARLLAVLGPLALVLAAIGLYAVLSYAVAQRTREIGVRLTLGATPASIQALVLWQSLRVVLVAVALGLAIAMAIGWLLRDALVGVPLGDPLIYLGCPALVVAVAALASWLPARRATRVDPMTALRSE